MSTTPPLPRSRLVRWVRRCGGAGWLPALLAVAAAVWPAGARGATAGAEPIAVGVGASLESKILGEVRPLQIYLPPGYAQSTARYPVLYLLDGDRHFLHVAGLVQFLAEGGRIPELIVVAVPNTNREKDFPPTRAAADPRPGSGPLYAESGGAEAFARFFAEELCPWVEGRYRTEPFRLLAGHSLGGLFAFHVLFNRPELFNAVIAASPALWWDQQAVVRTAPEKLRHFQTATPVRFLYFTAGNESRAIVDPCRAMEGLLAQAARPGLEWSYRYLADDQHATTPHLSLYFGLEAVFRDLQVPRETLVTAGLAGVTAHYAALPARYGYGIKPPKGLLDWAGYFLLQQEKPAAAVEVFEHNVRLYPDAPDAWASLAAGYSAVGRTEDAGRALRRAYRRAINW